MSHEGEDYPIDPIFVKELERSDIDREELAYYLHDGKENYERLAELTEKYSLDSKVRYQYHEFDHTREEQFYSNYRKLNRLKELTKDMGLPPVDYTTSEEYGVPMNTISSTSLHHTMFETVVRILGSDEQREYYLPRIISYEVLGCYAQTEMGHGSDVQGLMTEAAYDPDTDEFVVNTPSLKAIKFWPGELGKQSDH